jgi:hopanoid biosynthesis associated protein HpnK
MRRGATQLVVVADDFGRTPGVNRAILSALNEGIVTSTSLMAGGEAFEEAVRLARDHPRLAVGLHVTVCDGRAILPAERLPGLVGPNGELERSPARAGVLLWRRRRRLLPGIEEEIAAQFDRCEEAGIALTHVDGHHHMHIHPLLFPIICREASRRGVGWIRIPRGDLRDGRIGEWALFGALGRIHARTAVRHGLATAGHVHGLSRTGRVDEEYLLELLPRLTPGLSELFVHPDLDTEGGRRELAALTSPRVRETLARQGIELAAYSRGGLEAIP